MKKLFKLLLFQFIIICAGSAAVAGTANLAWDPNPDSQNITQYVVCWGETSTAGTATDPDGNPMAEGPYPNEVAYVLCPEGAPPEDVGHTCVDKVNPWMQVQPLTDCQQWFFALRAQNAAGISGYSNEVEGWPRPNISSVVPSDFTQGELGVDVLITGINYKEGVNVTTTNPEITVDSISRVDCGTINVVLSVPINAPAGNFELEVINPPHGVFNKSGIGVNTLENPTAPIKVRRCAPCDD